MITVKIDGVNQTIMRIKQIEGKITKASQMVVKETAKYALNKARALAPGPGKYGAKGNTGRLINSLTYVEGSNKNQPWAKVYAKKIGYPAGKAGYLKNTQEVLGVMTHDPNFYKYWKKPGFFKEAFVLAEKKANDLIKRKITRALK